MHGNTCVPAGCALASGSIDLGRLYVTATTSRLVYTRPLSYYAHPLLRNHKKRLRLTTTMFNYRFFRALIALFLFRSALYLLINRTYVRLKIN